MLTLTENKAAPLPARLQNDLDAAECDFAKADAELTAAHEELSAAGIAVEKLEREYADTTPAEARGTLNERGRAAGDRHREAQAAYSRIRPRWSAAKARVSELRQHAAWHRTSTIPR